MLYPALLGKGDECFSRKEEDESAPGIITWTLEHEVKVMEVVKSGLPVFSRGGSRIAQELALQTGHTVRRCGAANRLAKMQATSAG